MFPKYKTYLMLYSEVCPSGRIQQGRTQVPFQVELSPLNDHQLFETYHGVNIDVEYVVKVEIKVNFYQWDLLRNILASM